MSRCRFINNKIIKILIIVALIILASIIFPKNSEVNAYGFETSDPYGLRDVVRNSSNTIWNFNIKNQAKVFDNQYVYCVRPGMLLIGTDTYITGYTFKRSFVVSKTGLSSWIDKAYKYDIDNQQAKFAQGIAQILTHEKSVTLYGNDTAYSANVADSKPARDSRMLQLESDPTQIALWAYVMKYHDEANICGIKKAGSTAKYVYDETNETLTVSRFGKTLGSTAQRKKAYIIFNEALEAYANKRFAKGTFFIYEGITNKGTSNQTTEVQQLLIGDAEPEKFSLGVTVIKKDADTNKVLKDAEFTIGIYDNDTAKLIKSTTETTDSNGRIDLTKFLSVNSTKSALKVKITEDDAPDGYEKLFNTIVLKLEYDVKTAKWKVIGMWNYSTNKWISYANKSGVYKLNKSVSDDNENIELEVYNKQIEAKALKLNIRKVDKNDTSKGLNGEVLAVRLKNIKSIKVNKNYLYFDNKTLKELKKDKTYEYYKYYYDDDSETYTFTCTSTDDTIRILLKTRNCKGSSGWAKISSIQPRNINNDVILTMAEITPAQEYLKATGTVQYNFTYNTTTSSYTRTKPTGDNNILSSLTTSVMTNNTLCTITIKNKQLTTVSLRVLKRDKIDDRIPVYGAKFKISFKQSNGTNSDGTTYYETLYEKTLEAKDRTVGTDTIEACIDITGVQPVNKNNIIVKIEETEEPDGYSGASKALYIYYSYDDTNNKFYPTKVREGGQKKTDGEANDYGRVTIDKSTVQANFNSKSDSYKFYDADNLKKIKVLNTHDAYTFYLKKTDTTGTEIGNCEFTLAFKKVNELTIKNAYLASTEFNSSYSGGTKYDINNLSYWNYGSTAVDEEDNTTTFTSNVDSNNEIRITVKGSSAGNVKVSSIKRSGTNEPYLYIRERKATNNFLTRSGCIKINYAGNGSTETYEAGDIIAATTISKSGSTIRATITDEKISTVGLRLYKRKKITNNNLDNNQPVYEAEFDIEFVQDGSTLSSETYEATDIVTSKGTLNGCIDISNIQPINTNPIIISIKESYTPETYTGSQKTMYLKYEYTIHKQWEVTEAKYGGSGTWHSWDEFNDKETSNWYKTKATSYSTTSSKVSIYAYNTQDPDIYKFELNKTSAENGDSLKDSVFKLTFKNTTELTLKTSLLYDKTEYSGEWIGDYTEDGNVTTFEAVNGDIAIFVKTPSNGKVNISNIVTARDAKGVPLVPYVYIREKQASKGYFRRTGVVRIFNSSGTFIKEVYANGDINDNNVTTVDGTVTRKEFKVTITNEKIPPVGLIIEKKDSVTNQLLEDAIFKVTFVQNGKEIGTKTLAPTDKTGIASISGISPVDTSMITATVEEIEAPLGYNIINPISFTYTYNSGVWTASRSNASNLWEIESTMKVGGNNVVRVNENVKIVVDEVQTPTKIQIYKTDENKAALGGAEFYITVTNVKSLQIRKAYVMNSVIPANEPVHGTDKWCYDHYDCYSDGSGDIYTFYSTTFESGGTVSDNVIKLRVKTYSGNGFIKLYDIYAQNKDKNIYAYIKETKAPTGYITSDQRLRVTLSPSNNGKYEYEEVITNPDETPVLDYTTEMDENTVKVNVNNSKSSNLELKMIKKDKDTEKLLKDAKFNVTFKQDGELLAEKTVTTDENGQINIDDITVNNTISKVVATIKETDAPEGYEKLSLAEINLTFSYDKASDFWRLNQKSEDEIYEADCISVNETVNIKTGEIVDINTVDPESEDFETYLCERNEIVIYNTHELYEFNLKKTDILGNDVGRCEFTLSFYGIEELTVKNGYLASTEFNQNYSEGTKYDLNDSHYWRYGALTSDETEKTTTFIASTDNRIKITVKGSKAGNTKVISIKKAETKEPYVLVKERQAADGFLTRSGCIKINYDGNGSIDTYETGDIIAATTISKSGSKITATITNEENPSIFELKKTDTLGNTVDNCKFTLAFKDVKELTVENIYLDAEVADKAYWNYGTKKADTQGSSTIYTSDVNSNNEIRITIIVNNQGYAKVSSIRRAGTDAPYVYIRERQAKAGFLAREGCIRINYAGNGSIATYEAGDIIDATTILKSGSTITATITNEELIDLKGKAWLDEQTGIKPVVKPNGLMDTQEKRVAGIIVELVDENGAVKATTITNEEGKYEFLNIRKAKYSIRFYYDGVNYEEVHTYDNTITNSDSKASEIERAVFNEKFRTILKGRSSAGIALEYAQNNGVSKLITTEPFDQGIKGNPEYLYMGQVKSDFKIAAASELKEYTSTTEDINIGIVKREINLDLEKKVSSAKVKINSKEKNYNEAELAAGKMYIGNQQGSGDTQYLPIYESDYNYRIEDYFKEGLNKENGEIVTPDVGEELEIYLTYQININNKSMHNAWVNEITDYYDSRLTFVPEETKYYKDGNQSELAKPTIVDTNNVLTITGLESEKLGNGERNILYLTFKVNKDTNRNVMLGDYYNLAEIASYSTEGGYIDYDSAPGNVERDESKFESTKGTDVNIEELFTNVKEDDTSYKKLKIFIREENERTITGNVWEDKDGNGKQDNEDKINDVIVQLVENKSIIVGGVAYNFEYIWQETVSGGKTVTSITKTEPYTKPYEVTNTEGQYTFKGYIPGNYVIRFIYGDGTTATYDMTGNMVKYNGQDYKSTIDPKYDEGIYSKSNYTDTESIARDNESRRLQGMSYSTLVDSEKGMLLKLLDIQDLTKVSDELNKFNDTEKEILKSAYNKLYPSNTITDLTEENLKNLLREVLENTWMNADTSKIEVPVDVKDISIATTTSQPVVEYQNMNFGLIQRPQNKLTLEKHVTGMKITPTGVGTSSIVDAQKDIDSKKLAGIRKGLTQFEATRTSRNFWKLETDIEELLQGATLEVTYTYTVKQEGENDYISEDLNEVYKAGDLNVYTEFLKSKAEDKQSNGTYLSSGYYTGNGTAVGISRVESIEDYYEPIEDVNSPSTKGLVFTDEENSEFNIAANKVTKKAYLVNNSGTSIGDYIINKVVKTKEETEILGKDSTATKTAKASKVLSSFNTDNQLDFDSCIAQITSYSTATGRRDMSSVPGNLDYVYSEDSGITLEDYNEEDEFWAEPITITKSTGEDKISTIRIVIIATSSLAVIAVAIVAIKKFVLKMKH